jgi:hypothetical protein
LELAIPPIEFGNYSGIVAVSPLVKLFMCELIEKERIMLIDAYAENTGIT